MAAGDDGLWHCYFLKADDSLGNPELRHFNVSQGHATSADLVNWTHHGTCFGPSAGPAWDDFTTWTGSVLKGPDGVWHYFYTGTSQSEGGFKQRIGHATGTDMHGWERVGTGLALDLDPELHEEHRPGFWHDRALRDPWVMANPAGSGWLMAFTARTPRVADANSGGAVGLAVSEDLYEWTAIKPLFTGMFGQLEVPQLFTLGGRWYCLFSVGPQHWSKAAGGHLGSRPIRGTHYLMADGFGGPWRVAPGPVLTSCSETELYAGRVVFAEGRPKFMGFLHDAPDGGFVGVISDPIEITADSNGMLSLGLRQDLRGPVRTTGG